MKAGFCSSCFLVIPLLTGMTSCRKSPTQPTSESKPQTKTITADAAPKFSVPPGYKTEQKAWKENPGYAVLLTSAPSSELANKATLRVVKDGAVVATGVDTNEDCDLADDDLYGGKDGTACSVALDLAPYRISDNAFAIGVRWHLDETFPAGENNSEWLRLWRMDAGKLSEILEAKMTDSDEQRGPNEGTEGKCTLSVTGTKTQGYFDLVQKCASATGPLMDDPGERPDPAKRSRNTLTIFKWDGSKYVEQKGAGK